MVTSLVLAPETTPGTCIETINGRRNTIKHNAMTKATSDHSSSSSSSSDCSSNKQQQQQANSSSSKQEQQQQQRAAAARAARAAAARPGEAARAAGGLPEGPPLTTQEVTPLVTPRALR